MNWSLLLPGYLVTGLAVGVFALDLAVPRFNRAYMAYAGAALLALVGIVVYRAFPADPTTFANGILFFDQYSLFAFLLFIGLAAATVLGSAHYARRLDSAGEFFALLILSVVGAMGMAAAGELLTAYISLELFSFSLYILASYSWQERRTNEAGTKYILLGALASAFLLLGIGYLYGLTGTTRYDQLATELAAIEMSPGLIAALALITAGLGFKVAAVPFHMWTPDVYEGAPIPVVAYLAAASKAAGFVLLLRLAMVALQPLLPFWDWALLLLGVLSMLLGNLVAIWQSNIKRLMAYSSIGQAGYMLLGIAAVGVAEASHLTAAGLLFHMTGYAVTTLAAFFVILEVYNQTGREGVKDFAGLAERSPYLAMVLTAALFSLAGFPFFVGFASKFYLFTAVATAGPRFLIAVGVAILASLISLYYYLIVIRQMYIEKPAPGASRLHVPASSWLLLAALVAAMVLAGLYPRPLVEFAERAATALLPVA